MYPEDIQAREQFKVLPDELSRGASCIVDPLGNFLVEPVMGKEEILYANINLDKIAEGKYDFDVAGHYARPDVFQLIVNEEKQQNVIWNKGK